MAQSVRRRRAHPSFLCVRPNAPVVVNIHRTQGYETNKTVIRNTANVYATSPHGIYFLSFDCFIYFV